MKPLQEMLTRLNALHKTKTKENNMTTKTHNFCQYFTKAIRTNTGKSFTKLIDDAPEELVALIQDIHSTFDCLPNDWIYETIEEAFDELQDNELDDCSIEADCYNSALYAWFGEPFAYDLCLEYAEEFAPEKRDIYELISGGQWLAKDKIYRAVAEFLEVHNADV